MVRSLRSVGIQCVAVLVCAGSLWAGGSAAKSSKVIRQLSLDESAAVVELFDGIEAGQFQVRMSAKSAQESHVFIKNATDEPLTVKLPKAAVGVHILPQFFGQGNNGFGNNANNGNNLFGNNQNQGMNNQGRGQSVGGPLQAFGNNQQGFPNQNNQFNNPQFPAGNGFFSIPPEKTVQLKMRTVCLDYGAPDPHVGMKYELRRLEEVVENPTLQALLENFSPRVDQNVMQAAAWHLSSRLSWNQVASVPGNDVTALVGGSMFAPNTVKSAQTLVQQAEAIAKDRPRETLIKPAAATRKLATTP